MNGFFEWLVPILVAIVLVAGFVRRVPVYDTFVEGAEEGIQLVLRILPYLVGIFIAIHLFRASGALESFTRAVEPFLLALGLPPPIVPLVLIRPISGGAAMGLILDILRTYGPDSYVGRLASVMQGSSDTTFYVLSLYFGSVRIRRIGRAMVICLIGDLAAFVAALLFTAIFFG